MRMLGFIFVHIGQIAERIAKADIVWTVTEGEGFAIALFALRLRPRKSIICNVVRILAERVASN